MKTHDTFFFSRKIRVLFQILAFIMTGTFFNQSSAQMGAPEFPPGLQQFKAEAKLFTVVVVPKDKNAKIFFAGNAAAKIDFEKDHKLLEVYAFKKG